ncbi:MAG: TetR/AcrR family transcriptional regulator [Actinomycetota bacterium]|nr:TetR/AcrR family transcriptional regulator [Actinomycetota bacterium]
MTRLSKEARREQLLDTAAVLLLDGGARSLTMEGLAARAGVSKALPYLHFGDAGDVLIALHERELRGMSIRIGEAVGDAAPGEPQVAAAIGAYLDVIEERGDVLARLRAPGSPAMRSTGRDRTANEFVAGLLRSTYGLSPRAATVGAAAVFGAINGLVEAWAHGEASRRDVEDLAISVAGHVGRSASNLVARRRRAAV